MHRRVNILQYVKTPNGRWLWEPIPENRRTGRYLWSNTKSNHFYIVWKEEQRRRYQKVGGTPAEALEAKRRKEFELAGQAILHHGKPVPKPQNGAFSIEAAVGDFSDFIKNKKRPNTCKLNRAILAHFQKFFKPLPWSSERLTMLGSGGILSQFSLLVSVSH